MTADELARSRATGALDTSIALSAGAGTGKTTVLVGRILALLRQGVPPGRIVAITFTEKAAGEILARARDTLEDAARREPGLTPALADFGALRVGTIHGFCKGLLEAEALAGRWAPRVELDSAPGEPAAADLAFSRWRRDFDARVPAVGRLLHLLRAPVRGAATTLATFRDLSPVTDPTPFDAAAAFADLDACRVALERAAAGCRAPSTDLLLQNNEVLRRTLASVATERDPMAGVTRALLELPNGSRRGGKAADWPGGKERFVAALDGLDAWQGRVYARLHGVVVRDLHARYLPLLRGTKAEGGVADFDDLLFRALELLEDDGARARLAGGIDALLVDEVQDTDPIQARVAVLLTRAADAAGDWTAVPPRPGALFAVGDPKQSIYRFRRADVATWAELSDVLARDGESHALARNFRSVPGLVAWVNHAFSGMPGYAPLVAVRPAASLDPVVQVEADKDAGADALARHLVDLRARGARVVDRETREPRPLAWRDVMVLLPAWSKAEGVRARLESAGIPALVEGGATFFERDEVRLALAGLRAVDEPADAEAVVFTLRGLFGFSHLELAAHRAAGGAWRTTLPTHPATPVGDALTFLRDLHGERSRRGPVDLLDTLLDHTRAPVAWSLRGDGAARLANLDKLRALIRELEPASRTLGELIDRLHALAADGEEDLSRADTDADVVRITSYFKAKGLEAPVVAVVHANRARRGAGYVLERTADGTPTGAVAIKFGDFAPPGWDTFKAAEDAADAAERERWMYVAATRARDQLVLVREPKQNLLDGTAIANGLVSGAHEALVRLAPDVAVRVRVASQLPEAPRRTETFPGVDPAVDAALAAPPAAVPDPATAHRDRVRAAVRFGAGRSRRWRSVQELAMRSRVKGSADGLGPRGGTVVHEVMQRFDLGRPREVLLGEAPALCAALAQLHHLEAALADRCLDVVRRLLADPVLDLARLAPERWQEAPFAFTDRGRTVAGTIDLCFPLDEARARWMVVDWKSTLPPVGSPLRADYERQLAWYARALLATVGAREVETRLVGPHPELGAPSAEDDALAVVHEALAAPLRTLLDRGAPVPAVGLDVGEPVVATLELAWPDRRLGLGLDLDPGDLEGLRAAGWTVSNVVTDAPAWPETAAAWLAGALGLATEDPG